jgi:hypothetical protein
VQNSTGDALDLTGTTDTALVTPTGALIGLNGNAGLWAGGANEFITIDGLAYSDTGVAVGLGGQGDTLTVNGQAQGGDAGVDLAGEGGTVNIGSQGAAQGLGNSPGVYMTNHYGLSGANDSLYNAGVITGAEGVWAESSGGNLITNSGAISGNDEGIFLSDEVATDTVNNSGTISGGSSLDDAGIYVQDSSGVDIVNSGVISDGATNAAGSYTATLVFSDANSITDTIDNIGQILGAGYSIQCYLDNLDLSNSGTIHGGLWATGGGVVQIEIWVSGRAARATPAFGWARPSTR